MAKKDKTPEEKAAKKARKDDIKDKLKTSGKNQKEQLDDLRDLVVILVDMITEIEARLDKIS